VDPYAGCQQRETLGDLEEKKHPVPAGEGSSSAAGRGNRFTRTRFPSSWPKKSAVELLGRVLRHGKTGKSARKPSSASQRNLLQPREGGGEKVATPTDGGAAGTATKKERKGASIAKTHPGKKRGRRGGGQGSGYAVRQRRINLCSKPGARKRRKREATPPTELGESSAAEGQPIVRGSTLL